MFHVFSCAIFVLLDYWREGHDYQSLLFLKFIIACSRVMFSSRVSHPQHISAHMSTQSTCKNITVYNQHLILLKFTVSFKTYFSLAKLHKRTQFSGTLNVRLTVRYLNISTLAKTNSSPLKIGWILKGKACLPTFHLPHLQVRKCYSQGGVRLCQSGRVSVCQPRCIFHLPYGWLGLKLLCISHSLTADFRWDEVGACGAQPIWKILDSQKKGILPK